jgi:plastocyanin
MRAYKYLPDVVRVKAGTFVHFYNDNVIDHTVTTPDGTGDTGRMRIGNSYTVRFDNPGEYDFVCSFHSGMRMRVIVER